MNKNLEDAIRYISGLLNENPDIDRSKLIDESSRKFDLNPMQTDFLLNKYVLNR